MAKQLGLGLMAVGVAIAGGIGLHLSPSLAQSSSTDGITIFGGVENELGYTIDFNQPSSSRARYYMQVNSRRIARDITEIEIAYPEDFTRLAGRFNIDSIELREGTWRGEGQIEIEDIVWNQEEQLIEIYPSQPIPADSDFVVVMSDVRNPRRYGIHYFNLKVMYQGDVLRQYIGTWPLEVSAD